MNNTKLYTTGFTIVEILVAFLVLGFASMAIFNTIHTNYKLSEGQSLKADLHDNIGKSELLLGGQETCKQMLQTAFPVANDFNPNITHILPIYTPDDNYSQPLFSLGQQVGSGHKWQVTQSDLSLSSSNKCSLASDTLYFANLSLAFRGLSGPIKNKQKKKTIFFNVLVSTDLGGTRFIKQCGATITQCVGPPTADFSALNLDESNLDALLPATTTNYPNDRIQFTSLASSNTTKWDWDLGDGTIYSTTDDLNKNPPIHQYVAPGTYTVTLAATNNHGVSNPIASKNILIQPLPLVADFSANNPKSTPPFKALDADVIAPNENNVGDSINFIDASSGSSALTYQWDFQGDGVIDSTIQNPQHSYVNSGTYNVSLTISDSLGSTHSVTKAITIIPAACQLVVHSRPGRQIDTIHSTTRANKKGKIEKCCNDNYHQAPNWGNSSAQSSWPNQLFFYNMNFGNCKKTEHWTFTITVRNFEWNGNTNGYLSTTPTEGNFRLVVHIENAAGGFDPLGELIIPLSKNKRTASLNFDRKLQGVRKIRIVESYNKQHPIEPWKCVKNGKYPPCGWGKYAYDVNLLISNVIITERVPQISQNNN